MLKTDSLLQPHGKISANFNKEFATLSIHCVRPTVCSFQSDRFWRNSRSVSVARQARRSLVGFDVWGGFLQDQRWRGKKKKARANSSSEEDNNSNAMALNDKSKIKFDEKQDSFCQNSNETYRCLLLGAIVLCAVFFSPPDPLPMNFVSVMYSDFLRKIDNDQVHKVEVDGNHIRFKLKEIEMNNADESLTQEIEGWEMEQTVYTTSRPNDGQTPYQKMVEKGVEFGSRDKLWDDSDSFWVSLLLSVISYYVFCTIFLPLPGNISKEQGGAVTFADVGGVDEAKEELKEIVEFLRHPDRYTHLGACRPPGALLVGLPGTGKPLLAEAVAGEAGVPFIGCSAHEFGLGPSCVEGLFARARLMAPSVIFIDEIDAVGKSRLGHCSEQEQTLKQLLTEMDGLDSNFAVIVLAATSRADALEPALRCPGRFHRIVMVETPDMLGREAILKVHISKKKKVRVGEDVDLGEIASMTTGFTGGDLANVVNYAALLARRLKKVIVEKTEFIQAVLIAGKNTKLLGREKVVVARHEAGHAIVGTAVAKLLPRQPCVEKLSILPRPGDALGFTHTPPANEDLHFLFIDKLLGRLVTLLGGRAAEEVVYLGCVSTDALDDIRQATDMVYKAIAEYYLNENIGPVSVAMFSGDKLDVSRRGASRRIDQGHLVDLVQEEVKTLLQSALEVALSVVRANSIVLEGLSAHLEGKEKIEGEELQEWLKLVVTSEELSIFINTNQERFIRSRINRWLKAM